MSEYFSDSMFEKVFGAVDISLQLFDNWLTIERHFVEKYFEDIEKRIKLSIAKLFVKIGKPDVDFWIDEMQNKSYTISP